MICNICGINETNHPDDIYDDGKFSMINNDDISPLFLTGLLLYVYNIIQHN